MHLLYILFIYLYFGKKFPIKKKKKQWVMFDLKAKLIFVTFRKLGIGMFH